MTELDAMNDEMAKVQYALVGYPLARGQKLDMSQVKREKGKVSFFFPDHFLSSFFYLFNLILFF